MDIFSVVTITGLIFIALGLAIKLIIYLIELVGLTIVNLTPHKATHTTDSPTE